MKIDELVFRSEDPHLLSSRDPDATVWTAGDNAPLVVFKRVGDSVWFEVTGIASYRFPVDSADLSVRCEAYPREAVRRELIVDLYHRSVVPLALQVYGFESMHGTALHYDDSAVFLCAPTRTGKSTLARALAAKGAEVLADDGLVWEAVEGEKRVDLHPIPFSLMLRAPSREYFEESRPSIAPRGPTRSGAVAVEPVPVRCVLLLARSERVELGCSRLGRREAFTRLLGPAYTLTLADKERKGQMMAAYLRFASAVPVYEVNYPSGLERLDEVVEFVEGIIAADRLSLDS